MSKGIKEHGRGMAVGVYLEIVVVRAVSCQRLRGRNLTNLSVHDCRKLNDEARGADEDGSRHRGGRFRVERREIPDPVEVRGSRFQIQYLIWESTGICTIIVRSNQLK
jgi:hypothetical protein